MRLMSAFRQKQHAIDLNFLHEMALYFSFSFYMAMNVDQIKNCSLMINYAFSVIENYFATFFFLIMPRQMR